MLSLRDVHAFYGKSQVLHGVDLDVHPGEIVGLLGRNGSGRSTTLKAIMGLIERRGTLDWHGRPIGALKPFQIARLGIGYVPESRDVFPALSVEQNLLLGIKPHRSAAPRWSIDALFDMFPALRERRHVDAAVLSGGEQQMLALARTLVGDPELVLVDEPTEGLAPQVVQQVIRLLATLRERGVAVLLVEQKLTMVLQVSQRCCVMGHGRVVFEGTPAALRADTRMAREWLQV